jgi:L-cysteate sulfo-lyase
VSSNSPAVDHATARRVLDAVPRLALASGGPTPVEELSRLGHALGMRTRLLVKRDDQLSFGAGGNKVRKMEMLAARALTDGADTLVTTGAVQSNHARVTAAAAAKLGLDCVLVQNGQRPAHPTGNALLVSLYGARVEYVDTRQERAPRMQQVVDRLRADGRKPFAIPLGASTPLGALGHVHAIAELLTQIPAPDLIIHASSSGGTQAGLVAGCALFGLKTRILGMSVDDPAPGIASIVADILRGVAPMIGRDPDALAQHAIDVDDRYVGEGYGIASPASREAISLAARTEGLLLDPVYGAKAMAGLIAYARDRRLDAYETVLFWHTGGIPGLFA